MQIERLDVFEERAGADLRGLNIEHVRWDHDQSQTVIVRGELLAHEGTALRQDVVLEATVYDSDGRVLETSSETMYAEQFFAFEVFEFHMHLPPDAVPVKVRIYPKKR